MNANFSLWKGKKGTKGTQRQFLKLEQTKTSSDLHADLPIFIKLKWDKRTSPDNQGVWDNWGLHVIVASFRL